MTLDRFIIKMRNRGYRGVVVDAFVANWTLEFGLYAADLLDPKCEREDSVLGSGRTLRQAIDACERDYKQRKRSIKTGVADHV